MDRRMRRVGVVVLVIASLLVVGLGPAVASHNDVGVRYTVGGAGPSEEPETPDAMRPVYHVGGSNEGDLAWRGTFPRVAPGDQTGLGMGEWIGYIDTVAEYPGAGFNQCLQVISPLSCRSADDPLYRVNPAPGDEGCDGPEDRLNTSRCTGEDHGWQLDIWPPVRLQQHTVDPTGGQGPGSGFLYPGTYSFYTYLFGDGNGPAAGSDAFPDLPETLCRDHLDQLGIVKAFEGCDLITPEDLHDHTDRVGPTGQRQRAAVCLFAPDFEVTSGSYPQSCESRSEFNQYQRAPEGATYVNNKPGWYLQTGYIDPFGSLAAHADLPAVGGNRSDVAHVFHAYVNPVPTVQGPLWCQAPPVATNAEDPADTGWTQAGAGTWTQNDPGVNYLLEAHDLDVYTSPAPQTLIPARDVLEALLEPLADAPGPAGPLVGELGALAQEAVDGDRRVGTGGLSLPDPTPAPRPEPNAPGDGSFQLTSEQELERCSAGQGLVEPGATVTASNAIDARVTAVEGIPYVTGDQGPLVDPTGTFREGAPWHPGTYRAEGKLVVVEDLHANGAFDGCPPFGQAPGPGGDRCTVELLWDVYNHEAREEGWEWETIGERARALGFTDPTGLVLVLQVEGPALFTTLEAERDGLTDLGFQRATLGATLDPGPHCIVGTSQGLLDEGSDLDGDGTSAGERVRALLGLDPGATSREVAHAFCPEESGQPGWVPDAFLDGDDPGRFATAFTWTPLTPQPPIAQLTVHALLSVEEGGDRLTASTLALGTHPPGTPTLEQTWDGGDATYLWTDVDPHQR